MRRRIINGQQEVVSLQVWEDSVGEGRWKGRKRNDTELRPLRDWIDLSLDSYAVCDSGGMTRYTTGNGVAVNNEL